MAKIPFNIKYRPQIESGEYKVETKDGRPARIICWDRENNKYPIIFLAKIYNWDEPCFSCTNSGRVNISRESQVDLFIITPEPELSEFEQEIENLLNLADGEGHARTTIENTKRVAAELLALARKEIEKDLPRWKKADRDLDAGIIDFAVFHKNDGGDHEDWLSVEVTNRLYKGEYYIELSDLKKLPKEDEI